MTNLHIGNVNLIVCSVSALKDKGVVQINKKSFLYPNVPLLTRPTDIRKEIKCLVGKEFKNQEPQCMLVLDANLGDVLELVLLNEGKILNTLKLE